MENNLEISVKRTKDGSTTLFLPSIKETYHSSHGAIQEAKHVFIKNGLCEIKNTEISILEVGFGTGLNALLSSSYASENNTTIHYTGLETVPLPLEVINELNYLEQEPALSQEDFKLLHESSWEEENAIHPYFYLTKVNQKVQEYSNSQKFDVIFYDAFGPRAQKEMWNKEIFQNLYSQLEEGGRLVTYCAMGQFKRDLKAVGFEVKNVQGPPGKREMTIGVK